jgi:hypothetical protein
VDHGKAAAQAIHEASLERFRERFQERVLDRTSFFRATHRRPAPAPGGDSRAVPAPGGD